MAALIDLNIDEKLGGKVSGQVGKVTSEPIKSRLFEWLRDNPNVRGRGYLKRAARSMKPTLDYEVYKALLWKYASEYRYSLHSLPLSGSGSVLACCSKPDSQHACFAECDVPECLSRESYKDVTGYALEAGWRMSKNNNHCLIWDRPFGKGGDVLGRVQWFVNGTIKIHVLAPQTLGRAKQLLYSAFISTGLILDRDIGDNFLDGVNWVGSHDVYETGKRLPYKKLTGYEPLGVRKIVLGDNSHKSSVEVEVVKPEIVKKYEGFIGQMAKFLEEQKIKNAHTDKILEVNTQAVQQFNEYLKEVSNLPKTKPPVRLYDA